MVQTPLWPVRQVDGATSTPDLPQAAMQVGLLISRHSSRCSKRFRILSDSLANSSWCAAQAEPPALPNPAEQGVEELDAAATRIQAIHRGRKARRGRRAPQEQQEQEQQRQRQQLSMHPADGELLLPTGSPLPFEQPVSSGRESSPQAASLGVRRKKRKDDNGLGLIKEQVRPPPTNPRLESLESLESGESGRCGVRSRPGGVGRFNTIALSHPADRTAYVVWPCS